jgi:hypothetical protein
VRLDRVDRALTGFGSRRLARTRLRRLGALPCPAPLHRPPALSSPAPRPALPTSHRHPPPKRLRFDFSNNGAVDADKLAQVEAICREWVAKGLPVSSKEVALADAKAIKGLRAVFGEVRRARRAARALRGSPAAALLAVATPHAPAHLAAPPALPLHPRVHPPTHPTTRPSPSRTPRCTRTPCASSPSARPAASTSCCPSRPTSTTWPTVWSSAAARTSPTRARWGDGWGRGPPAGVEFCGGTHLTNTGQAGGGLQRSSDAACLQASSRDALRRQPTRPAAE